MAMTGSRADSRQVRIALPSRVPRPRPIWGMQRCRPTSLANGASGGHIAQHTGRPAAGRRALRSRMKAADRSVAAAAPICAASRVFTEPGEGYFAITTICAGARGGPEPRQVFNDRGDLGIGEHPLEGLHHGPGFAVPDHVPERCRAAVLPERGVAQVARSWLECCRCRTVAPAILAVTRRAALGVDALADVLPGGTARDRWWRRA